MLRMPAPNRRTGLLAIGYGVLLFLWLTPEDSEVWSVTRLGFGLAALTWLALRQGNHESSHEYR